jgi:CRISPR/Cas system-associated endoribonuclease Cas2
MTLYILTYDERAKHGRNYQPLYDLLTGWGAVHMQDSVWLANLNATNAAAVRNAMLVVMHPDDTVCVIQLTPGSGWATINEKPGAADWLRQNIAA